MKKYWLKNVQSFIDNYLALGGEVVASCEGCLGWGTMILQGEGLHNFVIDEVYLNEWSSGHMLYKYYGDIPKKWFKKIERENALMEQEQ